MTGLIRDLRIALRALARSPGFTAVAVATLALGLGANTAIFSVVDAVLLAPPPYPEPERLVELQTWNDDRADLAFAPATFLDLERDAGSFEGLAGYVTRSLSLTGAGDPERLSAASVSDRFFETLAVPPALGGGWSTVPAGEPAVLIGDGLWRRRFGADPRITGRRMTLDGVDHRIAGVLPADFRFPLAPKVEVWVRGPQGVPAPPFEIDGEPAEMRDLHYLEVLGRLAPGVTVERAREELAALSIRYAELHEDEAGRSIGAEPLHEVLVGDLRPALLLLLGAVCGVLLIACANVSGLMLARSAARGRELAIRSSLGAGRARLVRQALTEGLLLSLAGGLIGLGIGVWGVEALLRLAPARITDLGEVTLDARVLGFAALLSLGSVLLFSLMPALRASRPALRETLLEGGARAGEARGTARLRALLVVAETALALMLLIGAGLLLRSLHRLHSVDSGIRPDGVLAVTLSLPDAAYPEDAQVVAFWDQLHRRLEALPGVTAAGHVLTVPFGGAAANLDFLIEGEPAPAPGSETNAGFQVASGGYFQAIGIPLLRGRLFGPGDHAEGEHVAVVSRAFADRFFPGGDPIGRRINLDDDPATDEPWFTLVGIVGDVRHRGFDGPPRPEIYFPHTQLPWRFGTVLLRGRGDPAALGGAVRTALAEVDPDLPVVKMRPLGEDLAASTAQRRFLTVLLALFAALAAGLAALGLYGVIAYGVVQRRREIGIRMALGARPAAVLGSVIRRGLAYAAAGVALGAAGALALRRLLAAQLFEISAADPATYAAVALLLAAVAALASWLPARRAAAVDPAITLRAE